MRPCSSRVDRHDLGRGCSKEFTVVADVHDGLSSLVELLLEPTFCWHVEKVVGLIEHEHVEFASE